LGPKWRHIGDDYDGLFYQPGHEVV